MRVYSIFDSIDGEVNGFHQGGLTTFVRLAGCSLGCEYCDTRYAWKKDSGNEMSIDDVLKQLHSAKKVTITGGEPLEQKEAVFELINCLNNLGIKVSVETNGSIPLGSRFFSLARWVVDYKLPSSKVQERLMKFNFENLRQIDFVKFVIQHHNDFQFANQVRKNLCEKGCKANFAYSPVFGVLDPKILISWLYTEGPRDSVINLQLHKYLELVEDK